MPVLPATTFCALLMSVQLLARSAESGTVPPENKTKLYQCLNSCAMCVEHWEPGLYNGPRCAKQCVKHKGQRIVDPDCVKLKMFNYDPEVIKQHRKYIRQLQNENETEG